jgi:hypothetical protein
VNLSCASLAGAVRLTQRALLVLCLCGCFERKRPHDGEVRPELGIFYGGQVQEAQEIPFELDASRQTFGFRLRLDPAPHQPLDIRWELAMAGAGRPRRDSQGRLARPRKVLLGQARWRPGESTFEQTLPLSAGDPLGLWSVRVLVGDRVVLDRPFLVYDALERSRNRPTPFDSDAGL